MGTYCQVKFISALKPRAGTVVMNHQISIDKSKSYIVT